VADAAGLVSAGRHREITGAGSFFWGTDQIFLGARLKTRSRQDGPKVCAISLANIRGSGRSFFGLAGGSRANKRHSLNVGGTRNLPPIFETGGSQAKPNEWLLPKKGR
jgi:hypothetical protein